MAEQGKNQNPGSGDRNSRSRSDSSGAASNQGYSEVGKVLGNKISELEEQLDKWIVEFADAYEKQDKWLPNQRTLKSCERCFRQEIHGTFSGYMKVKPSPEYRYLMSSKDKKEAVENILTFSKALYKLFGEYVDKSKTFKWNEADEAMSDVLSYLRNLKGLCLLRTPPPPVEPK